MGRPRSENRMSRMVQARITDEQYDGLIELAEKGFDGDLSKAIRSALTGGLILSELLNSPEPRAAFDEMLERESPESGEDDDED